MGVQISYIATRSTPMSPEEEAHVKEAIEEIGVAPEEDEEDADPEEPMAEPFSVNQFDLPNYKPTVENEILYGRTKVTTEEQIDHWLELLAELRSILDGAEWKVDLEGAVFPWNPATESYDYPPE